MNDHENRMGAAFSKPHAAFVAFITAGDGDTAANLDALVAGGADVIELGMPFTDPMADGPAIQAANLRSLGKGTTTAEATVAEATANSTAAADLAAASKATAAESTAAESTTATTTKVAAAESAAIC